MKKVLLIILTITLIMIFVLVIGFFGYYLYVTRDTKFDAEKLRINDEGVDYYYDNNEKIPTNYQEYVSIDKLKRETVNAFIATEDKNFFKHNGIDIGRMLKAGIKNIFNRRIVEGGSTITQQLIKNTHLTSERTIDRKLKEIKLALDCEKMISKEKILESYLNRIYYGNGIYGLENASLYYFNKNSSNLTLSEAASLAATLKSPENYNPFNNDVNYKRRNIVLSQMKNQKMIDEITYNELIEKPLNLPHFRDKNLNYSHKFAKLRSNDILNINNISVAKSIKTSLNKDLEYYADLIVNNNKYYAKYSICIVLLDNKDNRILLYLNNDYNNDKYQLGSLIKPLLIYAPAFEKGLIDSPASILEDTKTNFGGYTPLNNNKRFSGNVTVRQSLIQSLNVPAVKLYNALDREYAKKLCYKMGIEVRSDNLTAALGVTENDISVFELLSAYSIFANGGIKNNDKPDVISEVSDKYGRMIYSRKDQRQHLRILSESTAFFINDILKDCSKKGTGKKLSSIGFDVASKTGTVGTKIGNSSAMCISYTRNHTLFVGLKPKISGQLMSNDVTGSGIPAEISCLIHKKVAELFGAPKKFEKPNSVIKLNLDKNKLFNDQKIILADEKTSIGNVISDYFKSNYQAKKSSGKVFEVKDLKISIDNNFPKLSFLSDKNVDYEIYSLIDSFSEMQNVESPSFVKKLQGNGKRLFFSDTHVLSGKTVTYIVAPKPKNGAVDKSVPKSISIITNFELLP